ncbi:MAG TPA: sensor histidine kinase [Sphingobacteriaceae bacterium]|nr:sensor histidine kinase [Sphingobacteriaceae bacterium]
MGFMSIALLGVMAMQYYFIRESYRLKVQLFDQSVNEALNAVVYKVEKRDADNFLRRKAQDEIDKESKDPAYIQNRIEHFSNRLKEKQQKIERDFKMRDSIIRSLYPKSMPVDNAFYETYIRNQNPDQLSKVHLQTESHQYVDNYGRLVKDEAYELTADDPDIKNLKKISADSVIYLDLVNLRFISLAKVNPKLKAGLKEDRKQVEREKKVLDSIRNIQQKASVFADLAKDYEQAKIPFSKRINQSFIDSQLKLELSNRKIDLAYDYKISLPNSDSIIFANVASKKEEFQDKYAYSVSLFPKELVKRSGLLTLTFPDKGNLILQNMSFTLLSSVSLLLVLVGCFAYTIFIILRQKKISEMKTDFINNMTHEFKTPVATIMIASEALKDPDITEDSSRIKRLAGIIYDENVRLGNHIERVLNIAKIDREDLKLEHTEVDMNDLITAVTDSMDLQLQKNQVKVSMDLQAKHAIVPGDELHLSNVIFNLIDNAIKYGKEDPEIKISTHNSGKNMVILVKDNGIGMNRDQLSKIFEQFYRIPTGNLHDVKGFGLGLSYVNNIIKLLQGTIHVRSERNKGSEFEIILRAI